MRTARRSRARRCSPRMVPDPTRARFASDSGATSGATDRAASSAAAATSFDGNQASAGAGLYQGHSDAQGRYAIAHVSPGGYFLVATRGDEDLNPMSFFGTLNFDLVTVPADETVSFDLVDSSAGACRVH